MTSTLDVLDSLSIAEATPARLFGGEGRGVGQTLSKQRDPRTIEVGMAEAMRLIRGVSTGQVAKARLAEAMTTSDFPIYFGAVLNRVLLAGYQEQTYSWPSYAARRVVNDFRDVKSIAINGGDGRLDVVPERSEYPESSLVESQYSWRIQKRGRRMGVSFEMMVNDDLDVFRRIPDLLGRGARRSEEYFAASLLADSGGPHASLWNVGNTNLLTGNPVLSRASLQTAYTALSSRTDPTTGEPIVVEAVVLVTGPALAQTAAEILNTTEYRIADGSNTRIITGNGLAGQFQHVVNRYIPTVVTTGSVASTAWWLLPAPNSGARPVLEMGFLRGHEQPETFVKAPNSTRVGGAGVDDFDFDTDATDYKVRHIFGGGQTDPVPTVASKGTGV